MSSEVKLHGSGLLEVDICDGAEEDTSAAAPQDDFSGFQWWPSPAGCPGDAASPSQQVVPEPGSGSGSGSGPGAPPCTVRPDSEPEDPPDGPGAPRSSIVDCLLVELYETYGGCRRGGDSWDSSTEASGSDTHTFMGRSNSGSGFLQELQEKHTRRHQVSYLAQKAPGELCSIIQEVKYRAGLQSAKLLRQLRRRDRLVHKLHKNYDIITACLQAVSQKRQEEEEEVYSSSSSSSLSREEQPFTSSPAGVDTRLKFTIEPSLGKNGFQQWYDALKAVARLPTGIPKEWRKRVWLTLADQYLHSISIDWDKTLRFAFNERSNPDDDSLGIQIVKDLHRTGCSSYCGQEGEQDRVVLKRVLLAYARWNKAVGYCQGFNVLAALILEVTEGNESDALKVMIYLIDKVLPESYFANNLRALSVDMAVFRDLLRLKLPRLSQHLHHLQRAANREAGGSYEPPLTNVFTMQWFLTMFATCLPAPTVLKIWDSVFFEGSEVLFRVALAIWERLGERIEYCQTADEFYSLMGSLTQEMLEHHRVDSAELMQEVYSMAVFPFPQLAELREKYTYNITPFPTSVKTNGSGGLGSWESDDDAEMDDEDSVVTALGCLGPLGGLLAPELQRYQKHLKDQRAEQRNISELSPGAVGAGGGGGGGGGARAEHQAAINSMMMERMSTDIYALKKQYSRIKRRQQQQAMQLCIRTGPGPEMPTSPGILQKVSNKLGGGGGGERRADDKCPATRVLASQLNPSSSVINHLLLGRRPPGGPRGARPTCTLPGAHPASLSQGQASPARQRCGSLPSNSPGSPGGGAGGGGRGGGAGSPWRAHVRQHRMNVARARAQLGFGDSEEREDEEEKEEEDRKDGEQKEARDSSAPPSFGSSVCEEAPEGSEVPDVVVQQMESLHLESNADTSEPDAAPPLPPAPPPSDSSGSQTPPPPSHSPSPSSPLPTSASPAPSSPTLDSTPRLPASSSSSCLSSLPPTPSTFYKTCSPSTPSLSSLASSSKPHIPPSPSTPALPSAPAAPKQQIFSPFPCVKQPRKSAAARNLGLYGPTSRTPTVHFPQLSRHLHRSAAAATTAAAAGGSGAR